MGALVDFAESTLLNVVLLFFVAGIFFRTHAFLFNTFRGRASRSNGMLCRFFTLFAAFFPFHRAAFKKPVYAIIRYAFHASIFIVPLWFSGHIDLWEESSLNWSWGALPDAWVDGLTLFVLITCVFFLGRRILSSKLRNGSSISDFVLLFVTGMPFLTGYLLTHGTLETIPFFEQCLFTLHILSGEVFLLFAVFLFCVTRLNTASCTGCAACAMNCPSTAIVMDERGDKRIFRYSPYQCITCGACVSVCPENAAELHHELSFRWFFQVLSKRRIRSVELETCARCGMAVGPKPQVGKIGRYLMGREVELASLTLCGRCKKMLAQKSCLFLEDGQTTDLETRQAAILS